MIVVITAIRQSPPATSKTTTPATAAAGHAGFLYNLARGMIESAQRQRNLRLPALPREALADDPFTRFDEWLDEIEQALGTGTALLALDEFEALDRAIEEGRFSASAILGMLRHLGQHRPRWKILLASSHSAEELNRWSSYLVNVQTVQIGYLRQAEARQLIEHPVPDALLRYEPAATDLILRLTHGHPFLVQLLCSEIVVLKNEQAPAERRLATAADVAAAAGADARVRTSARHAVARPRSPMEIPSGPARRGNRNAGANDAFLPAGLRSVPDRELRQCGRADS